MKETTSPNSPPSESKPESFKLLRLRRPHHSSVILIGLIARKLPEPFLWKVVNTEKVFFTDGESTKGGSVKRILNLVKSS